MRFGIVRLSALLSLGILLGPEEGEEGVTAVGPARSGERQVGQKGGSLGLREDRTELLILGAL